MPRSAGLVLSHQSRREWLAAAGGALIIAIWVALCWWLLRPPPLPPLADDAQRFGDCTVNRMAEGCGVWPTY